MTHIHVYVPVFAVSLFINFYSTCVCTRDQAFSALPDTYQQLTPLGLSSLIQQLFYCGHFYA